MCHARLASVGDDNLILGTFLACGADDVDQGSLDDLFTGEGLFDVNAL